MANPFEDEQAPYVVLVNDEGQYSLWREVIEVPAGWIKTFGPSTRELCLAHIEQHWTDMRPKSLIQNMDGPFNGQK